MRMIVAREGETPLGHYVTPGGLKLADISIPVYTQETNHKREPVAWATDLRRETGGVLTMEVKLRPEHAFKIFLKQYEVIAGMDNMVATTNQKNRKSIQSAVIGSLLIVKKKGGW